MKAQAKILVFPGSTCDRDVKDALDFIGFETEKIWHRETQLSKTDLIIIPGGFSFGDYWRPGAIAKVSPIMGEVYRLANLGTPILGICNGFQILCEMGLLPGALTKNESLRFICRDQCVEVVSESIFTPGKKGKKFTIPIAHQEGNFRLDDEGLKRLQDRDGVVFRYCKNKDDQDGNPNGNPNGSVSNIAGIVSEKGNVLGLMPHPERATDPAFGNEDGAFIFRSLLDA